MPNANCLTHGGVLGLRMPLSHASFDIKFPAGIPSFNTYCSDTRCPYHRSCNNEPSTEASFKSQSPQGRVCGHCPVNICAVNKCCTKPNVCKCVREKKRHCTKDTTTKSIIITIPNESTKFCFEKGAPRWWQRNYQWLHQKKNRATLGTNVTTSTCPCVFTTLVRYLGLVEYRWMVV